jgi:predicted secreted protein
MTVIKIKVNEHTELRFAGLGTAGYMWKCIIDDETKIKAEKRMDDKSSDPNNAGASRDEIFTVTGLQRGKTHATFIQSRHWEPDSEAINKVDYTFEIE